MRSLITHGVLAISIVLAACGDRASSPDEADQIRQIERERLRAQDALFASWNLPSWAQRAWLTNAYSERFELFLELNPFYVQGDLDGDGREDVAIQVVEKPSGKRGILVMHRRGDIHVLGAGRAIGNRGDDFSWLWVWRTESSDLLPADPVKGSDLLYVEKPESAGGLIWWDGVRYRWTQWGD